MNPTTLIHHTRLSSNANMCGKEATMDNQTRILRALSIFAALLLAWPLMAVAQPTDADFQQAVAAYQQSPSNAKAAQIIKLAAAMDQLPPIPE